MQQKVFEHIKKKYRVSPEYPWAKYPEFAVFRHSDNGKWFALTMEVPADRLGLQGVDPLPVINLKMDDMLLRSMILEEDGILPAYHMNKLHWITVLLDGRVPEDEVFDLLDMSYLATASAREKAAKRSAKEWIVPANPKYFDIVHAFDDRQEIRWKQGRGIRTGDTVYMYVGAPVSAILYKCRVTATDIPYRSQREGLRIDSLMMIKLQKRYRPDRFTFADLNEKYGIHAVRGPRGIPASLANALK